MRIIQGGADLIFRMAEGISADLTRGYGWPLPYKQEVTGSITGQFKNLIYHTENEDFAFLCRYTVVHYSHPAEIRLIVQPVSLVIIGGKVIWQCDKLGVISNAMRFLSS
jgi:hypothetical protein